MNLVNRLTNLHMRFIDLLLIKLTSLFEIMLEEM